MGSFYRFWGCLPCLWAPRFFSFAGNQYDSTPSIPFKRRCGRPKKDHSFIPGRNSDGPRISQRQSNGGRAHFTTGFGRTNGNHPYQVDAVGVPDAMVGVAITGLIEGTFDGGYLVSVKGGDSDTHLRGVVFKSRHYLPVTAENDVAPRIQLIKINEVPAPSANRTPVHGNSRHGRETNHHTIVLPLRVSPPCNQLVKYKGKDVATVPAKPPPVAGSRGTVIPVILEAAANLSNGVRPPLEAPAILIQPAHLSDSKGKRLYLLTDHGSPSPCEVTPKSSQTNGVLTSESAVSDNQADNSALSLAVKPSDDSNAKSTSMRLKQEEIMDLGQPIFAKPLQAIRSCVPDQSVSTTVTGRHND